MGEFFPSLVQYIDDATAWKNGLLAGTFKNAPDFSLVLQSDIEKGVFQLMKNAGLTPDNILDTAGNQSLVQLAYGVFRDARHGSLEDNELLVNTEDNI